ncbi:hypothetical protein BG004_002897 [Podila humilis]|nr:hypothetical protein BG004_002897 [Podila humilis]
MPVMDSKQRQEEIQANIKIAVKYRAKVKREAEAEAERQKEAKQIKVEVKQEAEEVWPRAKDKRKADARKKNAVIASTNTNASSSKAPTTTTNINGIKTEPDDEYDLDLLYGHDTALDDMAESSSSSSKTKTLQEQVLARKTKTEKKKAKKRKAKEKKEVEKALKKVERREARMAKGRPVRQGGSTYVDPREQAQRRESFLDQLLADSEPSSSSVLLERRHSASQDMLVDTVVPSLDDLKSGADFIGFLPSDDEEEKETLPPTTVKLETVKAEREQDDDSSNIVTAGHKRKRENDYGSDTEGSTGPPVGCPWMGHRQYSRMGSVPRMLTQELKDFVDFISPSPEEHKVREYIHRRVQASVCKIWPEAQVIVFGSFNTKLYLPSSDMDIVLLRKREFGPNDLSVVANALRRDKVAKDITVIKKARVPLVKFKETVSGLPVDISFNITNGIESAQKVKDLMAVTPILRPLTLLVKHFLLTKNMNEVFQGGIGSYTTMIMILSFLQMHPKIQQGLINPMDNLGVLFLEFFELYGTCFNYSKVGLSVSDGGFYFDKIRHPVGQPNFSSRPGEVLLCSVDPNDSTNDTARGSYQLKRIRETFLRAFGTLVRTMKERGQTLFPSASNGKTPVVIGHIRFDNKNRVPADSVAKSSGVHSHSQAQVSLIKGVMPIPIEILEQRQHIETVFYGGEYQRMFGDPPGITGLDPLSL